MPTHLYFRDTEFSLPSELLDVTHWFWCRPVLRLSYQYAN
jgi:hypothetical protein